jgi:hypothetical protein
MIEAKDAVVWVNTDTKEVMVKPQTWGWTHETPWRVGRPDRRGLYRVE